MDLNPEGKKIKTAKKINQRIKCKDKKVRNFLTFYWNSIFFSISKRCLYENVAFFCLLHLFFKFLKTTYYD